MNKFSTHYNKYCLHKSKKGVTIVEAVVAMAIIAIVTVVAVDFLTRFANLNARMLYLTEARVSVENALECFKYADGKEDFSESLDFMNPGFSVDGDVYTYSDHNYEITVTAVFGSEGRKVCTFSAVAKESSDKIIIEIKDYVRELS